MDGDVLRAWLDAAVPALDAARERIDAVNVFPVPDGDTGTNVLLTVRGAADAVRALDAAAPGPEVLGALGRGALLAARGNSGVIVSRYLGGLAEAAGTPLPEALRHAADAARTAVHLPEDGTVLTVAARVAEAAAEVAGPDAEVLAAAVAAGRSDLAGISAAHPVLRSARVVDAGACALLVLLDALAAALAGDAAPVDVSWLFGLSEHADGSDHAGGSDHASRAEHAHRPGTGEAGPADRAFEVMVVLHAPVPTAAAPLRVALAAAGDAVAVVEGDGVLTAHVHADDPRAVLAAAEATGARWTASVRALVGAPWPVVACTADPLVAGALALAGAIALVLPDGVPAPEARAAVDRATQDAGAPAPVVVLPGDRVPAGALDPAWLVPARGPEALAALHALVDAADVVAAADRLVAAVAPPHPAGAPAGAGVPPDTTAAEARP